MSRGGGGGTQSRPLRCFVRSRYDQGTVYLPTRCSVAETCCLVRPQYTNRQGCRIAELALHRDFIASWSAAAAADPAGEAAVSRFFACIGSPCLRRCVHGASIGGGGGCGG
jgi:hypothetical protein